MMLSIIILILLCLIIMDNNLHFIHATCNFLTLFFFKSFICIAGLGSSSHFLTLLVSISHLLNNKAINV